MRLKRVLTIASLSLLGIALLYVLYLNFRVTREFERRRWSEPAHS